MGRLIGKSNERILCKLSKRVILRLYSIVDVAMETTKTSNFTCQSKSFINVFFTSQVSACELQPFSCHGLANDIHSQIAKTVFSHHTGYSTNPKRTTNGFLLSRSLPFKCIFILHRHHAKHCYNQRHKENSVLVKEFKNIAP